MLPLEVRGRKNVSFFISNAPKASIKPKIVMLLGTIFFSGSYWKNESIEIENQKFTLIFTQLALDALLTCAGRNNLPKSTQTLDQSQ